MRLDRYIAKSRIIEIQSTDLPGALLELLDDFALRGGPNCVVDAAFITVELAVHDGFGAGGKLWGDHALLAPQKEGA